MKKIKFLMLPFALLFLMKGISAQNNAQGTTSGVILFIASTPCQPGTKPLPGMPENAACEFMKWRLELSGDGEKNNGGTFKIHCRYGMTKPGTMDFTGEKSADAEGNWVIAKGTATNPDAVVYRLTDRSTNKTISFLKLNNSLLHLLDDSGHLMIGNAGWSYTLNKAAQQ